MKLIITSVYHGKLEKFTSITKNELGKPINCTVNGTVTIEFSGMGNFVDFVIDGVFDKSKFIQSIVSSEIDLKC